MMAQLGAQQARQAGIVYPPWRMGILCAERDGTYGIL